MMASENVNAPAPVPEEKPGSGSGAFTGRFDRGSA
jgi:hypothetical protein